MGEPSNQVNCAVYTTKRFKQTWLDYYVAVKKGDLETVQNATNKDFRISLTIDKSALEIAALYGHKNLVEYFLERADEKKDVILIIEALKDALRGGHLDLAELVMDYLQRRAGLSSRVKENMIEDIIRAAINGKSLDCLKFMWGFAPRQEVTAYAKAAFSTGTYEILDFIRENCELPDDPFINSLPEYRREAYVYVGGGKWPAKVAFVAFYEYEKLALCDEEIDEGSVDEVGREENYAIITADRQEMWTLLDVAAFFGHLELVKREIDALKGRLEAPNLDERLQSAFEFSLRNNHVQILEYLIDDELVEPKPPYEYRDFNVNEAFHFVEEATLHIETTEETPCLNRSLRERMRVLCYHNYNAVAEDRIEVRIGDAGTHRIPMYEDQSAQRFTKIDDYYEYLLDSCGEEVLEESELLDLLKKALYEQNVDAALCFNRWLGDVFCLCEVTDPDPMHMDSFIKFALNGFDDFTFITSPVIVELLLGSSHCPAEHADDILRLFLKPSRCFDDGDEDRSRVHRTLDMYVRGAEAVLALLMSCGISKPSPTEISELFFNFFTIDLSASAGKVLALLNCTKLGNDTVTLKYGTEWLLVPWNHRVTFLTELLLGLYRIRWKNKLTVKGLLVYMLDSKSEDFTRYFVNLLKITRVNVRDPLYTTRNARGIIPTEERRKFDATLASLKERVPSLMECARHAIHHHYLLVAHESAFHVSAPTLVERAARYLPVCLQQFLLFDDVYENMENVDADNGRRGYLDIIDSRSNWP